MQSLSSSIAFFVGTSVRIVRDASVDEQLLDDGTYLNNYLGNDGKAYRTVKIGTQVWTADNLAETKFRNLTDIPNVTDDSEWIASIGAARCAYNNNEANV